MCNVFFQHSPKFVTKICWVFRSERCRSIAEISSFESVRFTLAHTGQCAPHRRISSLESVQFSLAQPAQGALRTFFLSSLQASLPGRRFAEALFVVFRLDSKDANESQLDRSRQELYNESNSNEYLVAKLASIQRRTSPWEFAKSEDRVRIDLG